MKFEIVLVAFAADPYVSSDGMAGWGFLQAALNSESIEKVHLLSNLNSIQNCKRELSEKQSKKIVYHAVGNSRALKSFADIPFGLIARLSYIDWVRQAKAYVKSDKIDFSKIDLVHQVTLATEIYPTVLRSIPGNCRKIIGPVGSSGNIKIFLAKPISKYTLKEFGKQLIRDLISKLRLRQISKQVDIFIGNNFLANQYVSKLKRCESYYFPNQIMPHDTLLLENPDTPVFEVLIIGQITPGKRTDLALTFLLNPTFPKLKIGILGVGSDEFERYIQKIVVRLGASERVSFLGNLSRQEVLQLMNKAGFLIHFSGREGSSFVVGEALSLGLPVLCLDGTGAADLFRLYPKGGISLDVKKLKNVNPEELLNALNVLRGTRANLWTVDRITSFLDSIYQKKYE